MGYIGIYDVKKNDMITTEVDYQNSSYGIDLCALLSKGLSFSISLEYP